MELVSCALGWTESRVILDIHNRNSFPLLETKLLIFARNGPTPSNQDCTSEMHLHTVTKFQLFMIVDLGLLSLE